MRILVAADGSSFTKRMLAYLAAHDEWLGSHHDYTVITVCPPVPARAASALSKEMLKQYYDEHAAKVFKPIRTFLDRQGLKVSYLARNGDAADAIVAEASRNAYDLLVLGSHGHGTLGNLVMGSVATKVMAGCKVPVLVVR